MFRILLLVILAISSPAIAQSDRNVAWSADFEDGELTARGSSLDSSMSLSQLTTRVGGVVCDITNITRANPGVITYANCPDPSTLTGFQVVGVGGMTQLNGQLVRACNVNTGAKTFQICVDNDPPYTSNDQSFGGFNLNTTGYGAYTSGGILQGFVNTSLANGGAGVGSSYESRVVRSGANTFEGDSNIACRLGSHCFRSIIEYHIPNLSNNKNKPRNALNPPSEAKYPYATENWLGWSMYVPSNQCDDTAGSDHQFGNQLMGGTGDGSSQSFLSLTYRTWQGSQNSHWVLRWGSNPTGPDQVTMNDVSLGQVQKGVWTDFVFRIKVENAANGGDGILQVWSNVAGQVPELKFSRVGQPVGHAPGPDNDIKHTIRQYKYGWHHNSSTCTQGTMTFGYDEIRSGTAVRDGTTFADVHPARCTETSCPDDPGSQPPPDEDETARPNPPELAATSP